MRLAFLGSPPFATPVLRRVLESRHEVAVLVTQPDRPRGRGRKIETSPLVELARERGIAVLQPGTTRDAGFVRDLAAHEPEILLVASYGEILRTDVLELAPRGALNVHASLLPRHRGASPIQRAILEGDRETGVTLQRMVLALDQGDVVLAARTPIDPRETAGELLARLAALGGEAAVEALDRIERGTATHTPQDHARATYAGKIGKDDGRIDWRRSAEEIERHVRAMTPWPGARTTAPDGQELVLTRVRVARDAPPGGPGSVLDANGRLVVAAGSGAVEVEELKPAGRSAMDGAAYLRGARLASGAVLGG